MRPVTDQHKVSRAKLAYLIDATAAPVCIIAPISSWAAAVSGFVEGEDGFSIFIRAIPYNYYALLTLVMMAAIILLNIDFGSMAAHEANALRGDLFTSGGNVSGQEEEAPLNTRGRVADLIIPIVVLIFFCVIGMVYTGGFFDGENFISAFSNSDASVGLALGSILAMITTILIYLARRVLSFSQCMDCLPSGFKAMVPAILILTFAWTLKAMTDSLGAAEFVATAMEQSAGKLVNFLPAIIFLVGCILHRDLLGYLRHSDPYCCGSFCQLQSTVDGHFHLRLHGRGCVRGPLLANFRHYHYGKRRCPMQPCKPCGHPASLRTDGSRRFLRYISGGRLCAKSVGSASGGNPAAFALPGFN